MTAHDLADDLGGAYREGRVNPRLPIYEYLTDHEQNPKTGAPIAWNFTKFLIGGDGQILNRFAPEVEPNNSSLVSAVEHALRQ